MKRLKVKQTRIKRRKFSIRHKVKGNAERLRLTVFRSLKHIYAQVINDEDGRTYAAASTLDKEFKDNAKPEFTKIDESKLVGTLVAQRALKKDIKSVAFDRNGNFYHGRIKALADAARSAGLEF